MEYLIFENSVINRKNGAQIQDINDSDPMTLSILAQQCQFNQLQAIHLGNLI